MHRNLRLIALGFLVASAACAHNTGAAQDEPMPDAPSVRVRVSNRYNSDMEIFVTGSGAVHRLGLVSPGLEREFELPQVVVGGGAVTFRAAPSGFGPLYESEVVRIRPGDIVDFQIATNLVGSRALVRP